MRAGACILIAALTMLWTTPVHADHGDIYVIDSGVDAMTQVVAARDNLAALGYSVSHGGMLTDYSDYGQVWYLRYNGYLNNATENQALVDYVADGGRLYLTGETSSYDTQNGYLISLIEDIGAGTLVRSGTDSDHQPFTSLGAAALNTPNTIAGGASYNGARTVETPSQGFLVGLKDPLPSPVAGSTVAWDFGQITGASSSRMVVSFDLDVLDNHVYGWTDDDALHWTENVATFLAAVPEPSTFAMLLVGAWLAIAARRRK